jgi:HK97 family phage major capsid protein/HK97 family phage prohead protease
MPDPNKYSDESGFMSDCISTAVDEGKDHDQAVAMCSSMWANKSSSGVIRKTHMAENQGMEFVLSDATADRYGDVILANGWDLANFKKNPIALFNHNPDFIVGNWERLSIKDGGLRGHLKLAPAGTSPRIDEIRKLIEAGILKAVSVGFRPIEKKPRSASAPGDLYVKSELVETSLVSVPANPNALAVAKSLKISDDTLGFVFAKHGNKGRDLVTRGNGKNAETKPPLIRKRAMENSLAQRIQDTEQRIVKIRDELDAHMKTFDDANATDEQIEISNGLTEKMGREERTRDMLKSAEARLGVIAKTSNEDPPENQGQQMVIKNHRPFAVPAVKVRPQDYLWRSLTVAVKHFNERGARNVLDVLKESYGEDEATRITMSRFITKAASIPADTTTSGWADTLVQTIIGDFITSLMPISIYPQLASRGGSFTFGRNGVISLPARSNTPTIAGSFVAQGAPIPVRQGAFTPITLTPKKMGVITTLTREITEHSTPAIEAIVRQAILDDTAMALDAILIDANAATTTRPAGLRSGVAAITATAGSGIAAVIGDLKALTSALINGTKGNLRAPVWIINPGDALAIQLTQAAAGGDLPFRDEIARGTLLGYPLIQSTSCPVDTMFLLDAADFITATGDTPNFSVSDQAVLHMEDTTPLPISSTGTPATVAAPARSLWQTDTMAIRMIMDVNWAMRRTGCVVWTQTMTWN